MNDDLSTNSTSSFTRLASMKNICTLPETVLTGERNIFLLAPVLLFLFFVASSFFSSESLAETSKKERAKKLLKSGESYYFKNEYSTALALFEEVIEIDPQNKIAYRYAGDIYLVKKKPARAKSYFKQSLKFSTKPAEDWFRIGQAEILEENGGAAISALKKALTYDPNLHSAHYYKGIAHYQFFSDKKKTIFHWERYREQNSKKRP